MKFTKEQKEKVFKLLKEFVDVKTWEGESHRSARGVINSYMARLEEIL